MPADPGNTEPEAGASANPESAAASRARRLAGVEAVVERFLYVSLIASGLALAGLMFVQVVLRYGFASPLVGIEELSVLFGAWFYFLGIAYVTRNGEHIHGGVLTMAVRKPAAVRGIRLAMTGLAFVASLAFAYYAIRYVAFELRTGRLSSYMRWPKVWWSASLVFGFAGTAFYLALQGLRERADLRSLRRAPGRE